MGIYSPAFLLSRSGAPKAAPWGAGERAAGEGETRAGLPRPLRTCVPSLLTDALAAGAAHADAP